MNRAVFLDRDGTINIDYGYVYKRENFVFIDGVIEGIRLLNDRGYLVIVVTNQSGIARGYYKESDIETLHNYINEELFKHGAYIDAFYYCPHHPEGIVEFYKKNCDCRKPGIGMLEAAIKDFDINRHESYLIGDNIKDFIAGNTANLKKSYIINKNQSFLKIIKEKILGVQG